MNTHDKNARPGFAALTALALGLTAALGTAPAAHAAPILAPTTQHIIWGSAPAVAMAAPAFVVSSAPVLQAPTTQHIIWGSAPAVAFGADRQGYGGDADGDDYDADGGDYDGDGPEMELVYINGVPVAVPAGTVFINGRAYLPGE